MGLKLAFTLFLLLSGMSFAQGQGRATVWFPLLVEDSHHKAVVDLTSESLVVTEHKIPATNVRLLRGTDLDLAIGIVIDTSRSQAQNDLRSFVSAAKAFAQDTIRRSSDRAFFMTFDITPQVTPWLAQERLSGALNSVGVGGGTALYDAIAAACKQYGAPNDWAKPTRRVLVVISDGEDNSSHVTRDYATAQALAYGITIFSLSTPGISNNSIQKGDTVMEDLAKRTGGKYFPVVNAKNAPKALLETAEWLNGMYFVGFSPPSTGEKQRQLQVKLTTKGKFEILYPAKISATPEP